MLFSGFRFLRHNIRGVKVHSNEHDPYHGLVAVYVHIVKHPNHKIIAV